MKRNSLLPLIALVILFAVDPFFVQGQNSKQGKSDLELRKKKINEEINQINHLLNETRASKKSSMGTLVNLNIRLQKRQELINTIHLQLQQLNREIGQNEAQVAQLKAGLEKLKKEYARMIVFAQRNQDAYSTLMFVFASESFNQAYARLKYMQQYSEFRRKQAQEIVNTQTQLLARLRELNAQKAEKNQLLGHEQEERKMLSNEKQEQEQVLTELQRKERELKTELEKKKDDAQKLQLAIRKLIEEEVRRKAEEAAKAEKARQLAAKKAREEKERAARTKKVPVPVTDNPAPVPEKSKTEKKDLYTPELSEEAVALSADFANNRGKLPWPVSKGVICETYGEHEHPAIKGFMMFNNGVEICATKGMQARAVFEGEVTGIAVSPAGGNLVIIRHGEYLSVYSNIDEVLVKTGQKVSVKQPIGTVLHNEEEGKSSMNLQIWKGQKTLDPGMWLLSGR